MFGGAGREYRWRYGTKRETFAKVSERPASTPAEKPARHLCRAAVGRRDHGLVKEVFDPLTRFQCCPPTCGAAAAILCSDEFAKRHGIERPVYIAGQTMTTDYASSFGDSMIKMVGFDMAKARRRQGL